ncbi:MAG: lysophospholipid acyltransferase family protein [Deltaproteobacteria bacterium]|nr:MAG: lysophospholipid acyltransferase family protein [Deltaproteobacteria bacterium]
MARRSLWRRLRRATRDPRNAALARAIGGFSRALGALPMPAALAVGRGLGTAAHALLATPRRLAVAHMGLAFPELDLATRRRLVRATFRHAGQAFAELSLFETILRRPDYIRLEGVEALDTALARGRGAIAVTGHVGNWELLAAWAAAIGYPITVVVRRVNDLRFHSLIVRFRAAAGVEVLVRDDPRFVAAVGDALRRNRVVAMLIDQDTRGAGVFVPFFGRPAHTPPGAALLALRARVPVVTAFIERRPEGGHLVRVSPVPAELPRGREGVRELTARLTAAIEAQIRRSPAEWVWWHERWRKQPSAAAMRRPAATAERALS